GRAAPARPPRPGRPGPSTLRGGTPERPRPRFRPRRAAPSPRRTRLRSPHGGPPLISRRTVLALGISQLVCWGISYYVVGVFGEAMAADLGFSRSLVHGGFSAALLVMAFS